jgi:hypothetical protein
MKIIKFIITSFLISFFLAFFWFLFLIEDRFDNYSLINKKDLNNLLIESIWKGFNFALPSVLFSAYYHFKKKNKNKVI